MDKASFTNRRGFLKTVAVGAGGYALGSLLIQPKSAYPQSIEGNLEKIPAMPHILLSLNEETNAFSYKYCEIIHTSMDSIM